jgi:hypothetical protein
MTPQRARSLVILISVFEVLISFFIAMLCELFLLPRTIQLGSFDISRIVFMAIFGVFYFILRFVFSKIMRIFSDIARKGEHWIH